MAASMREHMISQYITNVDFKGDWSLKSIKEGLSTLLNEYPAIEVVYEKDAFLNEVTGKAQEFKKLKSIKVTFSDSDDKFKTVEYLLEA